MKSALRTECQIMMAVLVGILPLLAMVVVATTPRPDYTAHQARLRTDAARLARAPIEAFVTRITDAVAALKTPMDECMNVVFDDLEHAPTHNACDHWHPHSMIADEQVCPHDTCARSRQHRE